MLSYSTLLSPTRNSKGRFALTLFCFVAFHSYLGESKASDVESGASSEQLKSNDSTNQTGEIQEEADTTPQDRALRDQQWDSYVEKLSGSDLTDAICKRYAHCKVGVFGDSELHLQLLKNYLKKLMDEKTAVYQENYLNPESKLDKLAKDNLWKEREGIRFDLDRLNGRANARFLQMRLNKRLFSGEGYQGRRQNVGDFQFETEDSRIRRRLLPKKEHNRY